MCTYLKWFEVVRFPCIYDNDLEEKEEKTHNNSNDHEHKHSSVCSFSCVGATVIPIAPPFGFLQLSHKIIDLDWIWLQTIDFEIHNKTSSFKKKKQRTRLLKTMIRRQYHVNCVLWYSAYNLYLFCFFLLLSLFFTIRNYIKQIRAATSLHWYGGHFEALSNEKLQKFCLLEKNQQTLSFAVENENWSLSRFGFFQELKGILTQHQLQEMPALHHSLLHTLQIDDWLEYLVLSLDCTAETNSD